MPFMLCNENTYVLKLLSTHTHENIYERESIILVNSHIHMVAFYQSNLLLPIVCPIDDFFRIYYRHTHTTPLLIE